MNNSYLNTLQKNYNSTGFTSLSRSIPFKQKSISQIKQENLQSRQYNRSFIETMYRSGNNFKYDIGSPYSGTYRSQLKNLESRVLNMVPEMDFEKNRLCMFNTQCINLRTDMKNDYKTLKGEMQNEVDNLQLKLMNELNIQKNANQKSFIEIKQVGKELVDAKNLIVELKNRINSLNLRIDGKKTYNSSGILIQDGKDELE